MRNLDQGRAVPSDATAIRGREAPSNEAPSNMVGESVGQKMMNKTEKLFLERRKELLAMKPVYSTFGAGVFLGISQRQVLRLIEGLYLIPDRKDKRFGWLIAEEELKRYQKDQDKKRKDKEALDEFHRLLKKVKAGGPMKRTPIKSR